MPLLSKIANAQAAVRSFFSFHNKLVWLCPLWAIYYLVVVWYSGFFLDSHHILFHLANDEEQYTAVADWIYHGVPSEWIGRRSFIYPLFMGFFRGLGGDAGVWISQGFLWLATVVLFYLCLQQVSRSAWVRRLWMLAYCLSWTPILLTLTVMTESLARTVLALQALFVLLGRWPASLISAGILAVIKPNYAPLFGAWLIFFSVMIVRKKIDLGWRKAAGWIAVSLVPMLLQIGLTRAVTGEVQNSNINHLVLQFYFYPQVLARVEGRDLQTVRHELESVYLTNGEMLTYALKHPLVSLVCVGKNLEENIRGVLYLDESFHDVENWWRKKLNSVFYWLHVLLFIPLLYLLGRSRNWPQAGDLQFWGLGLTVLLGILPTAITFWAADRLTSPLLPVWPLLYILLSQRLRRERAIQ